MTVDVSKLREGDVVTVRMTFVSSESNGDVVLLDDDGDRRWFPNLSIVSVEPRPLKVGDRVRREDFHPDFNIIAIDGGVAWIRADTPRGAEYLIDLSDLSPA